MRLSIICVIVLATIVSCWEFKVYPKKNYKGAKRFKRSWSGHDHGYCASLMKVGQIKSAKWHPTTPGKKCTLKLYKVMDCRPSSKFKEIDFTWEEKDIRDTSIKENASGFKVYCDKKERESSKGKGKDKSFLDRMKDFGKDRWNKWWENAKDPLGVHDSSIPLLPGIRPLPVPVVPRQQRDITKGEEEENEKKKKFKKHVFVA